VVPNAATMGFSNVMVGVSVAALIRGIAVHAARAGISHAVAAGVGRATRGAGGNQCSG
jgi:hypothetical protein